MFLSVNRVLLSLLSTRSFAVELKKRTVRGLSQHTWFHNNTLMKKYDKQRNYLATMHNRNGILSVPSCNCSSDTGEKSEFEDRDDNKQNAEKLTEEEKLVLTELEAEETAFREKRDSWKKFIPPSVSQEFLAFEDQSRVIQDVFEQEMYPIAYNPVPQQEIPEEQLKRGKTGVFDIGELVELLRQENAWDICVIRVPNEIHYADYLVIVTGNSPKKMQSLGTFIRKRFKMKERKSSDLIPMIGGSERNVDWVTLDMGNIILHVFTEAARERFDLESLWTIGPAYDDLSHIPDTEVVKLLKSIHDLPVPQVSEVSSTQISVHAN